MKVCYADESGHCGKKYNPDQPVEVLCGVVTDATKLFRTQRQHSDLLDVLVEYGVKASELKAAEIYRGRQVWQGIEPDFRQRIVAVLLEWSKQRKCKFIPCPIDSKKFFDRKKQGCENAKRFEFPWEAGAFNITLAIQREFASAKNNKGRTFLIFDEQKNHDERFLKLFESDLSFTDSFTRYQPRPKAKSPARFDQIVDIPHFSKSHLTVLIQLADLAAFIVGRHLLLNNYSRSEDYSGEREIVSQWYDSIRGNIIKHTSIDAPGKCELSEFYREVRPSKWTAKTM